MYSNEENVKISKCPVLLQKKVMKFSSMNPEDMKCPQTEDDAFQTSPSL